MLTIDGSHGEGGGQILRTAIGEHLADQLLLPLALGAGGTFTTTPLSGHSTTNMETLRQFVDREIASEEVREGVVRVTVR